MASAQNATHIQTCSSSDPNSMPEYEDPTFGGATSYKLFKCPHYRAQPALRPPHNHWLLFDKTGLTMTDLNPGKPPSARAWEQK